MCLVVYAFQEKLIFHPERLPADYRFRFRQPFEEVNLEPAPGVILNALLFSASFFGRRSPKGVILYFHGNAGSLAGWGTIATDCTAHGYDVFIMDYRTFGKSKGPLSEKALHQDARYAYNYLLKQYPEKKIIVCGRSLGSGIAARLASETHPKLLILETPFYNCLEMARHHFPLFPPWLLRYTFRTDRWIVQVKCPIQLFHGTDDTVVPYAGSTKLVALFNRKKRGKNFSTIELTTIEGGSHISLSYFRKYQNQLQHLLRE